MSNDNLKAQVEEYNEDFIGSEEKELINDLYTALQEAEANMEQVLLAFNHEREEHQRLESALQLSQEQNKVAVEALRRYESTMRVCEREFHDSAGSQRKMERKEFWTGGQTGIYREVCATVSQGREALAKIEAMDKE